MSSQKLIQLSLLLLSSSLLLAFQMREWVTYSVQAPLNGDEVAWVLDSRMFNHYIAGNFAKFKPLVSFPVEWSDPSFRVVDQPQFGKYVFGLLLHFTDTQGWQAQENLSELANNAYSLAEVNLAASASFLGPDFAQAVTRLRIINLYLGAFFILLFGFSLYLISDSILSSLFIQWLLLENSLVRFSFSHGFTISLVYSLSLFALLVFFSSFQTKHNIHGLFSKRGIALAGLITALAVSTKLNAGILLVMPVCGLILNHKDWRARVQLVFMFYMIFGLTFLLLEPEIWFDLRGLHLLISVRVEQTQRFIAERGALSIVEYVHQIFKVTRMDSSWFLKLLFCVSIISLCCKLFKKGSRLPWLVAAVLISIIGSNYYYGRAATFDHYLLPSLFVLYIIIGYGFSEIISWVRVFVKHSKQNLR